MKELFIYFKEINFIFDILFILKLIIFNVFHVFFLNMFIKILELFIIYFQYL